MRKLLNQLAGEHDADKWLALPLEGGEWSLADVADWGPAEDWTEWADAPR